MMFVKDCNNFVIDDLDSNIVRSVIIHEEECNNNDNDVIAVAFDDFVPEL
jgi:hypothetical protein